MRTGGIPSIEYLILVYLLSVVVIPYRSWQALLLGGSLIAVFVGIGSVGVPGTAAWEPGGSRSSFGHYYAENSERANRGIYGRTGIVGSATILALGTFNLVPLGVDLLGLVAHAIYDIEMAPFSAQEYTEVLAFEVRMSPTTHQTGKVGWDVASSPTGISIWPGSHFAMPGFTDLI